MPPVTEAQIAHHIPGRLRLKVPSLKDDPSLGETLGRELGDLEEVVEVSVRPLTGNVVVHYQSNGRGETGFVQSIGSVVRLTEARPVARPQPPPDVSVGEMAAEWTHARWQGLNDSLRRGTDGALDLRTVIPLFFVFLGVRQILTQPNLSALPWYTAFYYAYQTFNRYYGRPTSPARSGWSKPGNEEGAD
jgi:hypothetical protein